jgi:HK97 gp10 family phage protein
VSDAIQIEGLKDLSDLLTELTPRAAKRYLRRCAEPAAQVVLDALHETVPVGVGILEEQLSYSVRFLNDGDETTMEVRIGPEKPAFWGSFQEFGTATREGQHWMGRAWEGCKDEVLNVFATEAIGLLQDSENKKG